MSAPEITMGMVGNVYTRVMSFKDIGDTEHGHSHQFHHATLVAAGSVLVKAKGKETIFKAPHLIWINKDIDHELVALEPNTVCACIHGIRDADGEIVDPETVPNGVEFQPTEKLSLLP